MTQNAFWIENMMINEFKTEKINGFRMKPFRNKSRQNL